MALSSRNEDLSYTLVVDGHGATQELAHIKNESNAAVTAGGRLYKVMDDIGGKAGRDVANGLRSATFAMGSLGGKAGEVVAVLGDFSDLLLGGGLTLGLGLAAIAATKLYEVYQELDEQQKNYNETVKESSRFVKEMIDNAITPARDALVGLKEELRTFGKDTRQILLDDSQATIKLIDTKIDNLNRNKYREITELFQIKTGRIKGDLEDQQNVVNAIEARLASLTKQREDAQQLLDQNTRTISELDAAGANKDKADAAKNATPTEKFDAGSYLFQEAFDRAAEARQKEKDAWDKWRADMATADARMEDGTKQMYDRDLEAFTKLNALKKEVALKAEEERIQILEREQAAFKEFTSVNSSLAQGMAANGIAASQVLIEGMITQQKDAFAQAAIVFLKSTGTQLIGLGTKIGFEGAELTLLGAPNGPALIGLGAAAVGVGLGMGGLGSFIGAKTAGSAGGASAPTSGGVNRGGGGGRGGGESGMVQVNVYRGMYGPPADRDAEAIVNVIKLAQRSGRLGGVM